MKTFTVFFCGTSSTSFDFANKDYFRGELVSSLARNHAGMEFVDWLICDGPGSGNLQADESWVKPGDYSKLSGVLKGKGWEENVAHALSVVKGEEYSWSRTELSDQNVKVLQGAGVPIADPVTFKKGWFRTGHTNPNRKVTPQQLQLQKIKIFRKNNPIGRVNLIGWSRGGVTCHMMANAMKEDPDLCYIPVNIFALDPVPGSGGFQAHRTQIQKNVAHYIAVYAKDETSSGFAPILPNIATGVATRIYPFPGRHATVVGNAGTYVGGNGANEFTAPGKVVRHLAETYLTAWGTTLNNRLGLTDAVVLKLYDEMLQKKQGYAELRTKTYTAQQSGYGRDVKVGTNSGFAKFQTVEQLRPDPVFVNWHHRELFMNYYRTAYDRIFSYTPSNHSTGPLFAIRSLFPSLFAELMNYGRMQGIIS